MGVIAALIAAGVIWVLVTWSLGDYPTGFLVASFVAVAVFLMLLRLRPEPETKPSMAPFVVPDGTAEPDMSEELVDLLRTTRVRADRFIAQRGRPVPFVAWHDRSGEPHAKLVEVPRGGEPIAAARELARSLDASAPRVVICVPGRGVVGGKSKKCVLYEAAEHGFRDRTATLVQAYAPRRVIFGGQLIGKPEFAGEGEQTLRFSASAEA